jgi:hypothetical protein
MTREQAPVSVRRSRLAKAKVAARVGGRVARRSGQALGVVTRATRTSTSWTMSRMLGPDAYRRQVDDLVGRLADALDQMEAVLAAQQAEIEALRQENARLRAPQP